MRFEAGVAKTSGGWEGVIRLRKIVMWRCGHVHQNRDESTSWNPISARKCSSTVLDVFNQPEKVKMYRDWLSVARFARPSESRHADLGMKLRDWAMTQRRYLTI